MQSKFYNFIENYKSAFIVYNLDINEVIYVNQTAIRMFGLNEDVCDIDKIFERNDSTTQKIIFDTLKKDKTVTIYNYKNKALNEDERVLDLQLGFFNNDETEIFIELTKQNEVRMSLTMQQINDSIIPTAILNFDDKLSLIHCNDPFHKVFESNDKLRYSHFKNDLVNGFLPEDREELITNIFKNLENSNSYTIKIKVYTANGEERWYELLLEKRKLDNSDNDKIMAYMTNIEKQVEIEEENSIMQEYLTTLQELTDNILYRVDVKNMILSHTLETLIGRKIGKVVNDYRNVFVKHKIIHPEDAENYLNFLKNWYGGTSDVDNCIVRASLIKENEYKWYNILGKKLYDKDGNFVEVIGAMINVEEKHKIEEEFHKTQEFFSVMQEFADDVLYRIDPDTNTMYISSKADIFNSYKDCIPDYLNTIIKDKIVHPEDVEIYLNGWQDWENDDTEEITVRMAINDNRYYWYKIKAKKMFDKKGNLKEIYGKFINVQEQRDLTLKSSIDQMTNVLNKITFEEQVNNVIKSSKPNTNHALIFIDLDDFKGINDNYGHAFGDELLITVGKRLKNGIRNTDIIGRLGGDEFAVFLSYVDNEESTLIRCNVLLEKLQRDFSLKTKCVSVRASFGVALYPSQATTYKELIEKSDLALYQSKGKGKNVVSIYKEDINKYK